MIDRAPRAHVRKALARLGWLVGLALLMIFWMGAGGCATTGASSDEHKYAFWPQPPDNPQIQYLTSFTMSKDVIGQQSGLDSLIYGHDVQGDLTINKPYGVAEHDGKIYVCDTQLTNVTIMDLRRKEVHLLGMSGEGRLIKPVAIAVADDGTIYVADSQRPGVVIYDAGEHYVGAITQDRFRPVGVAVNQKELYVVNMAKGCIEVFNRASGKQVRTISKPGREPGDVNMPIGVALDKDGNVYVDDMLNCRLQRFSPDGKLQSYFGGVGDRPGMFFRPKHLAVDSEGYIYVVDSAFENVQMFNQQGETQLFFGAAGPHLGAMHLPAGLCITDKDLDLFQKYVHPAFEAQRLVFVTNQWGLHKVSVYAVGHLKAGKTLADVAAGRVTITAGLKEGKRTGLGAPVDTQAATSGKGVLLDQPAEPATQPAPGAMEPAGPPAPPASMPTVGPTAPRE